MKPILVERAPRSVDRYDSSAQAAIWSELEARKREAGLKARQNGEAETNE